MLCLQVSYYHFTKTTCVLGRLRHGHPLSAPCWKKFYLIGSLNASAVPLRHLWRPDPPPSASAWAVLDCPHSQQFCSLAWVSGFRRALMFEQFDTPREFLWKCTLNEEWASFWNCEDRWYRRGARSLMHGVSNPHPQEPKSDALLSLHYKQEQRVLSLGTTSIESNWQRRKEKFSLHQSKRVLQFLVQTEVSSLR